MIVTIVTAMLPVVLSVLASTQAPVNPDAALLADYQKRIDAYVDVRDKALKSSPPLPKKAEPEQIAATEASMAKLITEARADAKRGDIFSPEIEKKFRRLINPELKGAEGRETKAAIKDDRPPAFPLKVNGPYPSTQPLSTMPPNVLDSLPTLPKNKDLEYRFVGRHLILRDGRANLIIDYIQNVVP